MCTDGVKVLLSNRNIKQSVRDHDDSDREDGQTEYANEVMYRTCKKVQQLFPHIVVSKTRFSRDVSQIAWATRDIKTITFPSTIRKICGNAFYHTPLQSVVLNDGLEELEEYRYNADGTFSYAKLKQIVLPSTLRVIGNGSFHSCR